MSRTAVIHSILLSHEGRILANHEKPSESDEWYTPGWVFSMLGVNFDLDPCCGFGAPAERWCTNGEYADGLGIEWEGRVWLNPPYGGRNGIRPWLEKLMAHGDGIALVPNRTATEWWQDAAIAADGVLFVKHKIKFFRADGSEGKSPGYGNVLLAYGEEMSDALRRCNIPGYRSTVQTDRNKSENRY